MLRPVSLLPLRLFLGVTFVYAGVQKLSDPGFLQPGAPTYIGTQLRGFAQGTPGGWVLRTFALPHPQLAGVGVAVLEIAIGLLVLAGVLTRAAAVAGLALNLLLFLTSSWHTSPYFLGSDIVFVVAWLTLALAGTAGQPALQTGGEGTLTRRALLGAGLAGAVAAVAGLAALAKGPYRATRARQRLAAAPRPSGLPSGAVRLGRASAVRSFAVYRDPRDGSADVVVRQPDGSFAAFSAVCTHAGCEVALAQGRLVCPCHGSVFSAATGAVEQGPATQPLARKPVVERGGDLYALPA